MTLSNKLTISRLVMTFFLIGLLFVEGFWPKLAAFLIFIFACVTDFLDGWIARRRKEVSDFGRIMDPVADKVLVLGVFLSFVELHLIPAWMVVIIFIREFLITGVRLLAVRKGVVLAAQSPGKHKTVSQMSAIFFILLFLVLKESAISSSFWRADYEEILRMAILFFMFSAVILTIYSGYIFFWHNRKLFRNL